MCCAGIICAGGFAKVEQEAHVQNKLQNRCKKRKWMHEALQNKKQGSHLKGGIAKHVQDTLMQEEFQNLCKMHMCSRNCQTCSGGIAKGQGWKFDHRFFDRTDHLL